MKAHFENLFHLVFPALCISCRFYEPLTNSKLCLSCINSLPFISTAEDSFAALEGKDFFPESIEYFHALFYYTKDGRVADMVHRIKYEGQFRIGRYLGQLIGKRIIQERKWSDFVIVPVPIHPKRRKIRGFNQAEEIAKGISIETKIPYQANYLHRIRHETSQTGKDKSERSAALHASFRYNKEYKKISKVMLVDDVITTGSTVKACSSELRANNTESIAVVTLCISI